MGDPSGVHITRIYVNSSGQTPSPIRSSSTVPVCTSTPITNINSFNSSGKEKMALLAQEILASQRPSSETFICKTESPQQEQFVIRSKASGQQIDFSRGEDLGKVIQPNTGTMIKKKKQRQSLAVVPPAVSTRMKFIADLSFLFTSTSTGSSKSSDDGDYLVPMTNDMQISSEKAKTNFTSYDGIQMFTFTLDDD